MMRRWPFCFVLALQTFAWVSYAPNHALSPHKPGEFADQLWPEYHSFTPAGAKPLQNSLQVALKSKKGAERRKEVGGRKEEEEEAAAYSDGGRGRGKMGSSSPSCEHKCFGCNPCEAIQVPTLAGRRSHVAVQYTNYEPEAWKCKCGPSFYTP